MCIDPSYVGTNVQEDIASNWHSKQESQQSCAMTQTRDRGQDDKESQFPWRCDLECDTSDLHDQEEPEESELVELLQAEAMYRRAISSSQKCTTMFAWHCKIG
jgi:hypothetical protein